jgi:sulfite reductase (NADPH) hemoprotein beta-component
MNALYRETIGEDEILATLGPLLERWAAERQHEERFGDFVVRAGIVRAMTAGREFQGG